MKARKTKFYFNRFGIKVVIWKKEHRPKHNCCISEEQIDRVRKYVNELPTVTVPA